MGTTLILAVYALLVHSIQGCGQGQTTKTAQPNLPKILWQICCMKDDAMVFYNCAEKTETDTKNPIPTCTGDDKMFMFLVCFDSLPGSPTCSIVDTPTDVFLLYNGKEYNTELVYSGIHLVIMHNTVSRTQFFSKSRDQMRNFITEHISANIGDNNYWIGLDQMNMLTNIGLLVKLSIYIKSTQVSNYLYNNLKVNNYQENYNMSLDSLISASDYADHFFDTNFATFYREFLGPGDFSSAFCARNKNSVHTGWWYGEEYDPYSDSKGPCSDIILTTDDGQQGWGVVPITGAIMSIVFEIDSIH